MEFMNPPGVPAPLGRYSHAVAVPGAYRWLHISGQVGMLPDGSMARGPAAQLEATWNNLMGILKAGGMGVDDIVKVTTFLTPGVDVALSRSVRQRFLGEAAPASTLLIVAGLANRDVLVEIEAIAARPA